MAQYAHGERSIGAVDIGGTKIAVAAVSSRGQVLASAECPTKFSDDPIETLERTIVLLRKCERDSAASFDGIGIGCTGPVNSSSGVIGDVALLPGWQGINLAEFFAHEFGVSTAVENDANAAALAESQWGAGRYSCRFVYVTVSTGIGAGVVFDKKLYRGFNGVHPELGHHTIDESGPACYCGARGCWESLASGPALVAWMNGSGYVEPAEGEELTAREICELSRRGDPLATQAVERLGTYLGIGLGNLMTLFYPDTIALGGGVMQSSSLFLDRACKVARSRCGLIPASKVTVTTAVLGRDAPLLGAAMAWQHRFLNQAESK